MYSRIFQIILFISIVYPQRLLAQGEGAALEQLLSIELRTPQALFTGKRFYPGEVLTLTIEGTVTPLRRTDKEEECSGKLFGWCYDKDPVLKIVEEVSADPSTLPVLLRLIDRQNLSPDANMLDPTPATQRSFADSDEAYVKADKPSFQIDLKLPTTVDVRLYRRGFSLHGYIADKFGAGRPTQRNACAGLTLGSCGAGQYIVRVKSVQVDARKNAIISLLRRQPISVTDLNELIDVWLTHDIRDTRVVRNEARSKELSEAVLDHALNHHPRVATLGGGSRRGVLEKAVAIDPTNTRASAELVSHMIETGAFAEAKPVLAQQLPALKDDYNAERATVGKVRAHVFLDYAKQLVNAGNLTSEERAAVQASDVDSAVNFLGQALHVLDELRSRTVDWGNRKPGEAVQLYLGTVQRFASNSQLLRTSVSIDNAVERLKKAREFFTNTQLGNIVTLSGDGKHLLIADAPLRFESDNSGANPFAVEVKLPPLGIVKVIAARGSQHLVMTLDNVLAMWIDKDISHETAVIQNTDRESIYSAELSESSVLLARRETMQGLSFEVLQSTQKGVKLEGARVATLGTDRTYAAIQGDYIYLVSGDTQSRIPIDPRIAKTAIAITLDPGRNSVAVLHSGEKLALSTFDVVPESESPSNPDPQQSKTSPPVAPLVQSRRAPRQNWAVPGSIEFPTKQRRFLFTESKRLVTLSSNSICATREAHSVPSAKLICTPHGLPVVDNRLITPGIILAGAEVIAFAMAPVNSKDPIVVYEIDIEHLIAPGKANTATAAIRQVRLSINTDWENAFIKSLSSDKSERRLQVVVPFIESRLRVVDLDTFDQEAVFTESRFSGNATLAAGGRVLRVVDRYTNRLRSIGTAKSQPEDPTHLEYFETTEADTSLAVHREKDGTVRRVSIYKRGLRTAQVEAAKAGESGFMVVRAPIRDHSFGYSKLVLIPQATPSAKLQKLQAKILDPKGTITELSFQVKDPKGVIALLPHRGTAFTIERNKDGVYLNTPAGKIDQLLEAEFVDAQNGVEAFVAEQRTVLRAVAKSGAGLLVDVTLSDSASSPMIRKMKFKFDSIASNAFGGPARNFGIGDPKLGFVDSEVGLFILPGLDCLRVGTGMVNPSNNTESTKWKMLPDAVSQSLVVVARAPRVLINQENQIKLNGGNLQRITPTGSVPDSCPATSVISF